MNGKQLQDRDVLKQPETNTALSYYKKHSVETNFPTFAITFSH